MIFIAINWEKSIKRRLIINSWEIVKQDGSFKQFYLINCWMSNRFGETGHSWFTNESWSISTSAASRNPTAVSFCLWVTFPLRRTSEICCFPALQRGRQIIIPTDSDWSNHQWLDAFWLTRVKFEMSGLSFWDSELGWLANSAKLSPT